MEFPIGFSHCLARMSDNDDGDTDGYKILLRNNRAWVEAQLAEDPEFFKRHAKGQKPQYLWIGCADSRLPPNIITGTGPGEMFIHRNIANLVVHTDSNMLSVLQYAVEELKISHVIVCGHYGCGGVAAALGNKDMGLINDWLRHIKDVSRMHRDELRAYATVEQQRRRLVELNVIEQVYNLGKTSIIQRAWHERRAPAIHGWVYDVADGLIRDLGVNFRSADALDQFYRFDFSESGNGEH